MSVTPQNAVQRKSRACPECGGKFTHRSRSRGVIDKALSKVAGVIAFRCEKCDHRWYERVEQTELKRWSRG